MDKDGKGVRASRRQWRASRKWAWLAVSALAAAMETTWRSRATLQRHRHMCKLLARAHWDTQAVTQTHTDYREMLIWCQEKKIGLIDDKWSAHRNTRTHTHLPVSHTQTHTSKEEEIIANHSIIWFNPTIQRLTNEVQTSSWHISINISNISILLIKMVIFSASVCWQFIGQLTFHFMPHFAVQYV